MKTKGIYDGIAVVREMGIMRRNEKSELKQLRKLNRSDLLELLLNQTKKNERLELEIKELKTKIEEQRIAAEEAGSIAESARRLSELIDESEKAFKRCSDCKCSKNEGQQEMTEPGSHEKR